MSDLGRFNIGNWFRSISPDQFRDMASNFQKALTEQFQTPAGLSIDLYPDNRFAADDGMQGAPPPRHMTESGSERPPRPNGERFTSLDDISDDQIRNAGRIEVNVRPEDPAQGPRAGWGNATLNADGDPRNMRFFVQGTLEETGEAIDAARTLSRMNELSNLSRAARLSGNVPAFGAAAAVGAGVLTDQAHAAQREYIDTLLEDGVISPEAHEAYIALNEGFEKYFKRDIGISFFDGSGASALITAGVELNSRAQFKEWADGYAPQLSEAQYDTLAMSAFPSNSARTEMLETVIDELPASPQGQPEFLHAAIEAKAAYEEALQARRVIPSAPGFGPSIAQAQENIETTETALMEEITSVFSDPENIAQALQFLPFEDRLHYAARLAASEPNNEDMPKQLADYTHDHVGRAYAEKRGEIRSELEESPEIVDEYIMSRLGLAPEKDDNALLAEYAGDPDLAKEAAEAGMKIDADALPDTNEAENHASIQSTPSPFAS